MDFSNVKSVTIPEGEVKRIEANGVLLWKSGYTNLVLTSTTDPGGTTIYNGTGWYDGMRWSSSGGKPSSQPDGRLTGWMPFKPGATIRLKNFGMTRGTGYVGGCYFIWYKSNGTISVDNPGWQSVDEYTRTAPNDSSILYFRISAFCYSDSGNTKPVPTPPIVTIDEEITE